MTPLEKFKKRFRILPKLRLPHAISPAPPQHKARRLGFFSPSHPMALPNLNQNCWGFFQRLRSFRAKWKRRAVCFGSDFDCSFGGKVKRLRSLFNSQRRNRSWTDRLLGVPEAGVAGTGTGDRPREQQHRIAAATAAAAAAGAGADWSRCRGALQVSGLQRAGARQKPAAHGTAGFAGRGTSAPRRRSAPEHA